MLSSRLLLIKEEPWLLLCPGPLPCSLSHVFSPLQLSANLCHFPTIMLSLVRWDWLQLRLWSRTDQVSRTVNTVVVSVCSAAAVIRRVFITAVVLTPLMSVFTNVYQMIAYCFCQSLLQWGLTSTSEMCSHYPCKWMSIKGFVGGLKSRGLLGHPSHHLWSKKAWNKCLFIWWQWGLRARQLYPASEARIVSRQPRLYLIVTFMAGQRNYLPPLRG